MVLRVLREETQNVYNLKKCTLGGGGTMEVIGYR